MDRKNSLTEGPIFKGLLLFALPLAIGQLLQQLYGVADAWVLGNFSSNEAFAAVSSSHATINLIVGFFNGLATGAGVIIAKHFGSKNKENVKKAIHNTFLLGIFASVFSTVLGLLVMPKLIKIMGVPDDCYQYALSYYQIYFMGVTTVIMYNICMSIMRSLGDSVHPLMYLFISSIANVVLDFLLVVVFNLSTTGAAIATVCSQGLSVVLCLIRMSKLEDETKIELPSLKLDTSIMKQILIQGIPNGIQASVISIGNMVIQRNINSFGSAAMSGVGAYGKVEGFVFLTITCMSMALPTYISQNIGAGKPDRAKAAAKYGIIFSIVFSESLAVLMYVFAPQLLSIFLKTEEALEFGLIHTRTICPFFFLLAFSHSTSGIMRGCGRSIVPMISMLSFWCVFRVIYVTTALQFFPVFKTISFAYPITWFGSSCLLLYCLLHNDWEGRKA